MSGIAITFPGSPAEGQSYLAQNGFTYIYDSQKNRWKRGGDFVRAPKVLSYAGVAVTTTGSGITTGPNGALIYEIPGVVIPNSTAGIDSYKAYRYTDSYPNYTEIQVSISSAFSSVAYAATSTSTTFTIPGATLSGNTTYYLRARQFVGSNASIASTGEISGYSPNVVRFITTSVYLDSPTIVSIAGTTGFPVYQIGFAGTTLPATVTYTGSGVGNLDKVEWRVTGPRNPDSTGDTALAEVGIGTLSSATLANSLVLAMPFSGAAGVGITNDVNNAIRTASGASAGTTKTVTANGGIGIATVGIATTTAHFYNGAAYFDGTNDLRSAANSDFDIFGGDCTVEGWYYFNSVSNAPHLWQLGVSSVTRLGLYLNGGVLTIFNGSNVLVGSTVVANNWYHIAVSKTGTIFRLYVNGNLINSVSTTGPTGNLDLCIGQQQYGALNSDRLNGYVQDFRIYRNLAKYQENFTPPLPTYGTISYTTSTIGSVGIATTAFLKSTGDIPTAEVAIGSSTAAQVASSLVLAMPLNNTFGFQDINVAVRGLTSGASAGTAKTVGLGTTSTANAPSHPIISATESKWYDGAASFNLSLSQDLTIADTTILNFGTGDFTVECWTNQQSYGSSPSGGAIIDGTSGTTGVAFQLGHNATSLRITSNASGSWTDNITLTNLPVSLNTWFHVAFVRKGDLLYIFKDGILGNVVSGAASYNFAPTSSDLRIGYFRANAPRYMSAFLQDLKIYKGFAKYTTNFTPPQPICGFTTDLAIQTGFTTTSATGALLSSVVGLGSTSTLAFGADQTYSGITSITSSSGITTLPDTYAQNLVLALPLANITGVGNSFTNDRNTQIRTASLVGGGVTAGATKTITNVGGVSTVSLASTSKWYGNTASFNGTSQYLTSSTSTDFNVSVGDWTIEFWDYTISGGASRTYIHFNSGGAGGLNIWRNSSNQLVLDDGLVGQTPVASNLLTNTWQHFAFVRRSGVINSFIDGVFVGSLNFTPASSDRVTIGNYIPVPAYKSGYMQDVRVYNFSKYTSNFTPPPPMFGDYVRSTPNKIVFTPGSDYVLEARNTASGGIVTSTYSASRQWGTKPEGGIYDPYGANLVLAIPGGAVGGATTTFDVTGQIRFETPTATYVNAGIVTYSNSLGIGTYGNKSITNNGNVSISSTITKYYSRSMQFTGGTNSFLTGPSSTDFNFGTGDFTIEFWVYSVATGVNPSFFRRFLTTGPDSANSIELGHIVTTTGVVVYYTDGQTIVGRTIITNRWAHIALVRRGTIVSLYIDGVLDGSATDSNNKSNQTLSIGCYDNANDGRMQGHITDLKIYKGLAKYTSNFTPPNQIYLT